MKHFFAPGAARMGLAAALLTVVAVGGAPQGVQAQSLDQVMRAASAPYWQQQVDYKLQVQLDDRRHELRATEELTYVNHSPDQLTFIWFHLYPNAYRDTHTAFARQRLRSGSREFQFAPDSSRGFIDELAFVVNGKPARLEYAKESPDMAKLLLPEPLAPGGQVVIRTPFHVKLPKTWSRGGHEGQSYQITQWYPKPAVYDRAGWHPMPYLDQGEFYAEFGTYDVSITLPANYVVGATGELQNPEERAFMDSLANEGAIRAAKGPEGFGPTPKRSKEGPAAEVTPASSARLKTIRYVQDRVTDFAWFADKRYQALKSEVMLPRSGRSVTTWLLFSPGVAKGWLERRGDIDAAVLGYSRLVGEYPYSAATALAGPLGPGTGGMEYPMVTITEPSAIVHEVGHNWFQGILGSNERDYPWMDEGVNSYTENRVKAPLDSSRRAETAAKAGAKVPGRADSKPAASGGGGPFGLGPKMLKRFGADGLPEYTLTDVAWQASVSRGLNQPISTRSDDFHSTNYGADVYARTPAELRYLAAYLGQARFDSCMHAYYRVWAFRHPQPADMLGAFNAASGEELSWFFRDRLTTLVRPDAGLGRLRVEDSIRVRIYNQADSLLTVPVATIDAEGRVLAQRWTPLFREQGTVSLPLNPAAVSVVIDPNYVVPTVRRSDDRLRLHGPFRAWNPLRLQPLLGFERWDRTALTWAPLVGANTSDKFMAGVYLSNSSLLQRRVRFQLAPLYSFARNEVNGYGEIAYSVLGTGRLAETVTAVQIARFQEYLKLEPSLLLRFRATSPQAARQTAQLGITLVRRDPGTGLDPTGSATIDDGFGGARWLRYELRYGNALNQLTVSSRFENFYASALTDRMGSITRFDGANVGKLAVRYERYYSKKKSISLRVFGGGILNRRQDYFFLGMSGSPDYLRETIFLDRSQISRALQAGPRQTDDRDGGFHAWIPVVSNRWLAAANLEAQLPKVPLSVYGDLGTTPGTGNGATATYYGTGVVASLLSNALRVYFPIAGSNYAQDTPASWRDFSSNIRFALHLENLLPERQIRTVLEK